MTSEIEKPRIGITTGTAPAWRSDGESYMPYACAVASAGGAPVPLGPGRCGRLEDCDGILITGGGDIHPRHYRRFPGDEGLSFDDLKKKYCMTWDESRDAYELPLVAHALQSGIPALAICRGLQTVNVVLGGTLIPDIAACTGSTIAHKGCELGRAAWHDVEVGSGSVLARILTGASLRVNSYHHQGLLGGDVAPSLRVTALAPDGIVEAMEGAGRFWLVAVQWHPERSLDESLYEACLPLFEDFVRAAGTLRHSQAIGETGSILLQERT
jgi:putative glutamine amidotransferase